MNRSGRPARTTAEENKKKNSADSESIVGAVLLSIPLFILDLLKWITAITIIFPILFLIIQAFIVMNWLIGKKKANYSTMKSASTKLFFVSAGLFVIMFAAKDRAAQLTGNPEMEKLAEKI